MSDAEALEAGEVFTDGRRIAQVGDQVLSDLRMSAPAQLSELLAGRIKQFVDDVSPSLPATMARSSLTYPLGAKRGEVPERQLDRYP